MMKASAHPAVLRFILSTTLYISLALLFAVGGVSPWIWILVLVASLLYAALSPIPSTLAMLLTAFLVEAPLMPVILGVIIGVLAQLALEPLLLPGKRFIRLDPSSAAMVLASSALILGAVSVTNGLPGLDVSTYFKGLALALAVSVVLRGDRPAALLRGAAAGFSWYGLPVILSSLVLCEPTPDFFETGVRLGEIETCARTCRKLLRRRPSLCWSPVYPGVLRVNIFAYRNPHVLIVGMSGSGKTTLAKRLAVASARRDIGILILDIHGEYLDLAEKGFRVIDASEAPLNLLDLEGSSPREKASEIADLIQQVFGLGNLQRVALEQLIEEAYEDKGIYHHEPSTWSREPPTLLSVAVILRSRIEEASTLSERSRLAGIAMYIDLLSRTFHRQTAVSAGELVGGRVVIRLDRLPGEHIKALYAETLLRRLALTMYRGGLPGPQLVFVEEAHRLASRRRTRRSMLARLLVESRKYGLGFIIISQQPLDLDEAILANTWLKFVFSLQEPRNIEYITRIMGVRDQDLHTMIKGLDVGEALVEAGGTICRARIDAGESKN